MSGLTKIRKFIRKKLEQRGTNFTEDYKRGMRDVLEQVEAIGTPRTRRERTKAREENDKQAMFKAEQEYLKAQRESRHDDTRSSPY